MISRDVDDLAVLAHVVPAGAVGHCCVPPIVHVSAHTRVCGAEVDDRGLLGKEGGRGGWSMGVPGKQPAPAEQGTAGNAECLPSLPSSHAKTTRPGACIHPPTLMAGARKSKPRRSEMEDACLVTRATCSTCCRTSSTLMLLSRCRQAGQEGQGRAGQCRALGCQQLFSSSSAGAQ